MKKGEFEKFTRQISDSPSRVFVFTSRPFDWIGKVISFVTQSKCCHAGIIVKNDEWTEHGMVNAQWSVYEATFKSGVRRANAFSRFEKRKVIMNVFDLKMNREQEDMVINYMRRRIGQKYDWIGAITGFKRFNKTKQYCSMLVIKALRYVGYAYDANSTWRTTPADISQLLEYSSFK